MTHRGHDIVHVAARVGLAVVVSLMLLSAINADTGLDDRLHSAILNAVSQHNGFPVDQIELTVHAVHLPDQCRTAEHITITIPSNDNAIGPLTVRATFEGPIGDIAEIPIPARVRLFADAVVASNRLIRHEPIATGDVSIERVEVTRKPTEFYSSIDSLIGRWPMRTINVGQLITCENTIPAPTIERGDRVTMYYESGSVRVSTSAVAMEDGYRDQTIRVKGPKGKRLITVVVVDEQTVRPTAY